MYNQENKSLTIAEVCVLSLVFAILIGFIRSFIDVAPHNVMLCVSLIVIELVLRTLNRTIILSSVTTLGIILLWAAMMAAILMIV